nr:hypothetical protein BgiMline_023131 [Biomphalaria glabrata]
MFKQPNNVDLRNKTNANDNVLDKNSNITTTKTKSRPRSSRTTKDNGLKLMKNSKQKNLHEEFEKSTPLVKANLRDKNSLEVLSNTIDLPAKNVSCLTADEPCDGNSSNEDSCKGDESRISVDEDLTLRFSQDPIMSESQDGDPMCDVRWDYGSPEIVKKVKKRRGHFSAESVKMALANFSDAHMKPQKESFNYVGVMLQHPSFVKPEKSKVNRAKQRALKKNQHGFQEMMVSFLQDLTKRQGSVIDSNNDSSTQISFTSDQPVDDNLAETGNQELGDLDVNYWSDEDLFKDNSLLMEATYNPEKFVTTSPGVDKRLSSSISDSNAADLTLSSHDTSVIPSSCHASCVDNTYKPKTLHCTSSTLQSHKPIQSHYTHSNKIQLSNAPVKSCNKTNTSSTVVSSNTWTRNTTPSNTLSGKSSQSNSKVALKKYNSFHIDAPNASANNQTDKSHVTPLRKTLSFDYSHSSQSSVQKPLSSNYAPSLTNNTVKLNAPKVNLFSSKQSDKMTGQTKTLTPTEIRTFSLEEDNLPEDVIQQLLEPDEILDSQDYNPVKPSSMMVSLPKPENKTTFQFKSVNQCDNKSVNSNPNLNLLTGSNSSNRLHSVTNSSLSKPVHTRSSVNPNQRVQRVSSNPVQALVPPALQKSPKQFYGQAPPPKFIQKSSHHTSTPVKGDHANKGADGPEQSDTSAKSQVLSDSFIENVFNDSFLNDEALYESQILPLLDQVESEAMRESQSSQQPKSSPPTQCSPDEIERKRQAALQKRMFSLSQRKNLQ